MNFAKTLKKTLSAFTLAEKLLWLISVAVILLTFFIFDGHGLLTPAASLIGVTSLIFNAKGRPFGQFLMIVFSIMYGIISFSFSYYGEMITYLGMTAPMALFALISWIKNPYDKDSREVKVNKISRIETVLMLLLTAAVTAVFYFILAHFNTQNIIPSTVSVTTSFLAVYLTFRRSPFFALAYAANDAVLIALWVLASIADKSYIPVTACFAVFLINDVYGFVNWQKMKKRQSDNFRNNALR